MTTADLIAEVRQDMLAAYRLGNFTLARELRRELRQLLASAGGASASPPTVDVRPPAPNGSGQGPSTVAPSPAQGAVWG